jgi:hypothetical protein
MGVHRKEDAAQVDSETTELSVDDIKKRESDPPSGGGLLKKISPWTLILIDRVVRTVVQAATGYITALQLVTPGQFDVREFLGIVGGSALVSIGTAIISAPSFDDSWWYQIIERAVKTFVQVFISAMVTFTVAGETFSVIPSGVIQVLSGAGIAALASILTSVVGMSVGATTAVDLVVPPESGRGTSKES